MRVACCVLSNQSPITNKLLVVNLSREALVSVQPSKIFTYISSLTGLLVNEYNIDTIKIQTTRWLGILLGLICLLVIAICVSCALGAAKINPVKVLKIFLNQIPFIHFKPNWTNAEATIVLRIRGPQVFMAGLIGGALTLAGIAFQALLRNPLAEPYILGVSSGGALGAMIAIAMGIGTVMGLPTLPFFAFLGSLLAMFIVYNVARVGGRVPSHTLLLAGVIINFFFSAIIMYVISIIGAEKAHSFQFWTMGDLGSIVVQRGLMLVVTITILISGIVVACYARNFNILILGEETAAQLGVEVERMKVIVFILASLMTGAAVSACGMIGFVGLIIPHLGRMLIGADHRILIPASSLIGATFLIFADTLSRTLQAPQIIPVGVITAICGGPFFIYLLRTRKQFF